MGSNLCASKDPSNEKNRILKPGEAAWRPPNGTRAGLKEAGVWKKRDPRLRQQILDPDTLEVDPNGPIDLPIDLDEHSRQLREDGWGEIHWTSYGTLLVALQMRLNAVFEGGRTSGTAFMHWALLNKYDRTRWNASQSDVTAELTTAELKKVAAYHYPVYACGYNWLQSNEESAARLCARIAKVRNYWNSANQDCKQVILVTHSMGGLVARACAKQIPEQIAGIVHGVMPALGAPVCYRRIACGTESTSPSNAWSANVVMGKVADIVGRTPKETTPVMSIAPGPLELLPTHLFPEPWLFARVRGLKGEIENVVLVPPTQPYDFYRDTTCWYRMIDPAIADPAGKFKGLAVEQIARAIRQAEKFHRNILGDYYHPRTYAFYGADEAYLSYGTCRWIVQSNGDRLSAEGARQGEMLSEADGSKRHVRLASGESLWFEHSVQDRPGDGTVPQQSGAGPSGKVAAVFRTAGYDHQGSYGDEAMLMLTQHLIAKIVQVAK